MKLLFLLPILLVTVPMVSALEINPDQMQVLKAFCSDQKMKVQNWAGMLTDHPTDREKAVAAADKSQFDKVCTNIPFDEINIPFQ